jgi:cell division protease FtsH
MSQSELLGKIKGLLAGRAAEELGFGEVSTGASNDLEKVADIVKNMLTVYGMGKHLPNLSLVGKKQNPFLGQGPMLQHRSEKLEEIIDEETQEIIKACYENAKQILLKEQDKLERMAHILLEKEKIDEKDILDILGPRAHEKEVK